MAIACIVLRSPAGSQAASPLAACGEINYSDGYTLTSALQSAGTCLAIHDIVRLSLNCQSQAIRAGNAYAPGIGLLRTGSFDVHDCLFLQQGSGAVAFELSLSTETVLYWTGGEFEGAIDVQGVPIVQLTQNLFPTGTSQSCGTNPMLCTSAVAAPTVDELPATTAVLGRPFSYRVNAAGTDVSTLFYATGLPTGITIDSLSGVISGTPTLAAHVTAFISVSNRSGVTTKSFNLTTQTDAAVTQTGALTNPFQVYPNPWREDKHRGRMITFNNLSPSGELKIFTVSGHLVKTTNTLGSTYSWNLLNNSGQPVGAGLYIASMNGSDGRKARLKLAVIR